MKKSISFKTFMLLQLKEIEKDYLKKAKDIDFNLYCVKWIGENAHKFRLFIEQKYIIKQ